MKDKALAPGGRYSVELATLDSHPEELWAGGTCWDLRASGERPVPKSRPSSLIHLHTAGCAPEKVPTPLWDAFLEAAWPEAAIREWVLLVMAVGLTGHAKKVLPVLRGGADAGKTTLLLALDDILGTYSDPVNSKIFESGQSHDTVLYALKGLWMAYLDEGVSKSRVATNQLKRLAGGSRITANQMRRDPVTFAPTHTLVLALNPTEDIPLEDKAVIARVRELPCEGDSAAVIAASAPFDYFRSSGWKKERPGVLAKMMGYAAKVLSDPRAVDKDRAPLTVQIKEQENVERQDAVLRWFLEATEEGTCEHNELFTAFREWTRELKGDKFWIPSENAWGERMNELVPEDGVKPYLYHSRTRRRMRRRKPLPPGGGYGPVPPQTAGAAFFAGAKAGTVPYPSQPSHQPSQEKPSRSSTSSSFAKGAKDTKDINIVRRNEEKLRDIKSQAIGKQVPSPFAPSQNASMKSCGNTACSILP
jgi:hypothetical protein